MRAWISSSLRRFYPSSPAEELSSLTLAAARGERVSFQAVCRSGDTALRIEATASVSEALIVQVRRVGYVPIPHLNTDTPPEELEGSEHIPGYVPDPLWPDASVQAGPCETHAFWLTVTIPRAITPASYPIAVTISSDAGDSLLLTAQLVVHAALLPQRREFPVTHWLYADALSDWYRVEPFSEAFWPLLSAYLTNAVSHGQDTLYVPLFTPPLDGVKRPTQLLEVHWTEGHYHFDWTLVGRWLECAQQCGIVRWEWTHLFSQWGAEFAIRIYEGHGETNTLLWPPETTATSDCYRGFLQEFLPAFEQFLRAEKLLEHSYFHLSDEPHGDETLARYRAAREMLQEIAPWMRIMDALSDVRFAHSGLTDIPIPLLTTAPEFIQEGFPAWTYFCCVPRGRYLNRLLDTPLAKIRMAGWLFYRLQAHGFLHWGYNYWYRRQSTELIDPFTILDGHAWPELPHGDLFVVYPGAEGPIDSIRWEIFAESLQDYALLQASLSPEAAELTELRSYQNFPHTEEWIAIRREIVLTILDRH